MRALYRAQSTLARHAVLGYASQSRHRKRSRHGDRRLPDVPRPSRPPRLRPSARRIARRAGPRRPAPRRPAPGEWAVCEVLGHLADAEIALAFRIRKVAAEPGQVLVAWDQDRWAEGGRYRRTPLREALATFTALRRSNLAYVARLSAAQRGQHGRHPEYGG